MKARKSSDPLVGKFFHRPINGDPTNCNQGGILRKIDSGHYLVQLCSWLDGRPTTQEVVSVASMTNWILYTDQSDWVRAGNRMTSVQP